MKNQIKYILTSLFLMMGISSQAQSTDTLLIATSGQCNTCKKTLENDMKFEKGVESVNYDIETQILTVVYKPEKTTPEKVKTAVTKIGYDADEMPADPKAYSKLPDCCKKGGHSKH